MPTPKKAAAMQNAGMKAEVLFYRTGSKSEVLYREIFFSTELKKEEQEVSNCRCCWLLMKIFHIETGFWKMPPQHIENTHSCMI